MYERQTLNPKFVIHVSLLTVRTKQCGLAQKQLKKC